MDNSGIIEAIRDLAPENMDDLFRDLFEITKTLFSFTDSSNFEYLIHIIQTFKFVITGNYSFT